MPLRTMLPPLLAALALAGCTTPDRAPQATASATPEDRLVAAIEAQGCALSGANVEAVLLDANLTQAELPALTASLASQGRIEAADDATIRLLSVDCI
jgi:hypothetical protein